MQVYRAPCWEGLAGLMEVYVQGLQHMQTQAGRKKLLEGMTHHCQPCD